MNFVRIHHTQKSKVRNFLVYNFRTINRRHADWYQQKLAHPWYLPSVNPFLSIMDEHSWKSTPTHSNVVETAHAARNAETGTGKAILTAINELVHLALLHHPTQLILYLSVQVTTT